MTDPSKINGTYVTKEEADKMGFNYDLYDYEAKMVGAPGQLVIDSVFRVIQDMAVAINNTNDGYFIVKIGDPENPGISFVQLNPPIRVATKAKVFGETFYVPELIEALKNPIFQDDAPVSINMPDMGGDITLIGKCPYCEKLHVSCVIFEDENEEQDEVLQSIRKETKPKEPAMEGTIYLDRTDGKYEKPLTRKELIDILEKIPEKEKLPIGLDSYDEEGRVYSLTNVYKCSEKYPAIHLDCAYDEHNHGLN